MEGALWFHDDLEVVGEPARAQCHPLPDDLLLLSELGRAEATAIRHLERSNEQLLEELQFAEDTDFREAVEENLGVLQQKYANLAAITEKISRGLVLRARSSASSSRALPASSSAVESRALEVACPGAVVRESAADMGSERQRDDMAITLLRMQTLLKQVKRKASELEDDLIVGDLEGLMLGPRWERKAARLRETAALPGIRGLSRRSIQHRAVAEEPSALEHMQAGLMESSGGASASSDSPATTYYTSSTPSACLAGSSDSGLQAAEQLGVLLRGVRRKAAELEDDAMAADLHSLSLAERPACLAEHNQGGKDRGCMIISHSSSPEASALAATAVPAAVRAARPRRRLRRKCACSDEVSSGSRFHPTDTSESSEEATVP